MAVNMLDAYDEDGEFDVLLALDALLAEIDALRKQHEEDQKRINRFNKVPEQTATHPNQKVVQFDDMGNLI